MENTIYDVIIIGAGVSGTAIARELSRYELSVCVVEKEEDVCCGTSKANSGIVHAGYDAAPGSLMAKLNVQGNEMMETLAEELEIPFQRKGSLVVCHSKEDRQGLQELYDRGQKNAVPNLQILEKDEVLALEPNIQDTVEAALYAPTAGIVCPFELNIAMAENACVNGVEFRLSTEVKDIRKIEKGYELITDKGALQASYVVNAAGVYADVFHNLVSREKIHITPRRGTYCLLDKKAGSHVSRTVFALPDATYGKGVMVTPTVHGNLLVGPTASDILDKDGIETTSQEIQELLQKGQQNVKDLPLRQVITSFAGLRAHEDGHEFVIGEVEDAPGFIDCAGIESPGLTSSPAIGVMVAEILVEKLHPQRKKDFIAKRKGILKPQDLSPEEYQELIAREPAYGTIVCRCEMVTQGEIQDAIRRPLGARTLDGVKRRTRAGMGRCQAGFCMPRTMEILSQELGIDMEEVTKNGRDSRIIVGRSKELK